MRQTIYPEDKLAFIKTNAPEAMSKYVHNCCEHFDL